MPDGLYERDFLLWSEQQADLLRRLAAGERVNESVDWANLVEEVADLGGSELRACESFISLILLHVAKIKAGPDSQALEHWNGKVDGFLIQLQAHFTPAMASRIDVARLYAKSMRRLGKGAPGLTQGFPSTCPFSLDDFVLEDASITDLLEKLDTPSGRSSV